MMQKAFPYRSMHWPTVASATLVHVLGDDGQSDSLSFVDTMLRFARVEQSLQASEMNVINTIIIRRQRRSTVNTLDRVGG